VKAPFDRSFPIHELDSVRRKQFTQRFFITLHVAQFRAMLERELQRLLCLIKAHDPEPHSKVSQGSNHGQRIGGCAKTNVPDDELTTRCSHSLPQFELPYVERLRLCHGPNDRMERLPVRHGTHAVCATREPDQPIRGLLLHGTTWPRHALPRKPKRLSSALCCKAGMINNGSMDPLLKLLHENATLRPSQLAAMLDMPETEVVAKTKAYEAEQVILAYRTILNEEKLGIEIVRAVIEVKITPERGGGFDRLAERIAKYTEVNSCYLMSGGYDLMVVLEGKSLREIATFVSEKLATIQGVISTATHFMLKPYKVQGVLMKREVNEERLAVTP
jgi:DNA-binding Lrp family transcriptional regulator